MYTEVIIERGINNCFTPSKEWTLNCYKVMDLVATKTRDKFKKWASTNGNKCKDISTKLPYLCNPEYVTNFESSEVLQNIYKKGVVLTLRDFALFPATKHLNSKEIQRTLTLISNYQFTGKYRIMTLVNEKYKFQHFIDIENDFICNLSLIDKTYTLKFESILGSLFLHNVYAGAVSVLPDYIFDKLYNLPKYPSLFFRKYLLHLNHIIYPKIDLHDVRKKLNLTTPGWNKQFKEWLKILENSGLISIRRLQESCGNIWVQCRRCNVQENKRLKKDYENQEKEKAIQIIDPGKKARDKIDQKIKDYAEGKISILKPFVGDVKI